MNEIRTQGTGYRIFYILFALISTTLLIYYLSDTIIHFTSSQQFPVNSFSRFPLTFIIFPAELFSAAFAIYFVYVLLSDNKRKPTPNMEKEEPVAILLPVYHEPSDIVERTIKACKKVTWKKKIVYLLDDSTDEDHINEMKKLAKKYKCKLIRRDDRKGYKAGNVNNGVQHIKEPYFVILDADQAPLPEFLQETMPHFTEKVAFVQTPQYYLNDTTPLERAVKLGANIFFQSQCAVKAADNALPFCGTNAVIRTDAFKEVGGLSYYTSTEDIELGLRFDDKDYTSVYVPKILAFGYGPTDFSSYASQQYRWANGNLAILRENWLRILGGNFTMRQQIHTLFTLGWWLIGIVTLAYIFVPLLSLILNQGTHHTWLPTTMFVLIYVNVVVGIGMIYMALKNRTSLDKVRLWDAFLQYSLITNSMFIYARAAINALFKRYVGFVRTNKNISATSWRHVKWNLLLGVICFAASMYALTQGVLSTTIEQFRSFIPISLWLLFYAIVLFTSLLFVGKRSET